MEFNKLRNAVLGTTGTGKTISTLTSLARQDIPFLFIDTINIDKGSLTAEIKESCYFINEKFDMSKFNTVIKRDNLYLKLNNYYNKDKLITALLNYILDRMKALEFYICIDEVHLYKGGQTAIERLATTGRNFNKYLISLSQAPQQVSNVILRQSERKIMFKMDMQKEWFRTYGLPYDEYIKSLENADIHHFVTYENISQRMSEAQKVSI